MIVTGYTIVSTWEKLVGLGENLGMVWRDILECLELFHGLIKYESIFFKKKEWNDKKLEIEERVEMKRYYTRGDDTIKLSQQFVGNWKNNCILASGTLKDALSDTFLNCFFWKKKATWNLWIHLHLLNETAIIPEGQGFLSLIQGIVEAGAAVCPLMDESPSPVW